MAGVNKRLFYGVNILLTMVAGLISVLIILMRVYARPNNQDQNRIWDFVEAPLLLRVTGICVVATLGIYGASKDKKWPLIAYITANVIGVIMFLIQGTLFVKAKTLVSSHSRPGTLSSPLLQGTLAVDCILAINFVPAALGFIGIILAAMIMHQLNSRQPALSDVEGEPPGYSQMCPMSSKSAESWTYRILPNHHTANDIY